jgi:hypothetical protein
MPENFPAGQFLGKVGTCLGVCIVNWSMLNTVTGAQKSQTPTIPSPPPHSEPDNESLGFFL